MKNIDECNCSLQIRRTNCVQMKLYKRPGFPYVFYLLIGFFAKHFFFSCVFEVKHQLPLLCGLCI